MTAHMEVQDEALPDLRADRRADSAGLPIYFPLFKNTPIYEF